MPVTNHPEAYAVIFAALSRIAAREVAADLLQPGNHKIELALIGKVDGLTVLVDGIADLSIGKPATADAVRRLGPIKCDHTLNRH